MEVREHREELLSRIPRLRLAFVALLAVIGSAYWFVQVVRGDHYRELADHNRLKRDAVKAPRGLIFDRDGRLLVDNVPSYDLMMDRSLSRDLDASIAFAAEVLERDRGELDEALARHAGTSRFSPILLAENLSLSEVARFSVSNLEHPEFEIEVGHLRLYRHGPLTAHVLGYLGEVSEDELRRPGSPYRPGDLSGKRSVERTFDDRLRGTDGEKQVVVDSRGRAREEHDSRPAQPGERLVLTIDLGLQQLAARYFEDKVGAAVALDPRNGEVLVMVSAPSYNPNLFARRMARDQWRAIVEAPHRPLQNRAIQNTYSPGSLFKIVVAVAGLSERVVTPHDSVFCGGATRVYNRRFRCWKRAGHGRVDLHEAIKESCDVYFYHLGQKLGISRIAEFARLFGLGQETRFDIGGERAGLVPDLEWSLEQRGSTWYPGETISVAIGQGPLLTTPLQMASLMAIVANGGYRVQPHLDASRPPSPPEKTPLDDEALAIVREALRAVVNDAGTGASAKVSGFEIAGKTGTAQVIEQTTWTDSEDLPLEHRDHAWFASFGPVAAPELVVVVFVENGGKGSAVAAPLARSIYERYRDDRGLNGPA